MELVDMRVLGTRAFGVSVRVRPGADDIISHWGGFSRHDGASCHASRLIDADGFSILHFLFLIKMAYLPDDIF